MLGTNGVVASLVFARFAISGLMMLLFFPKARQALVDKQAWLDGLILGFLMKILPSDNIKTVTFGIPGTFDFEIGNYIAKKLKTNHLSINLNDYPLNKNDLVTDSKGMQSQCYLFCKS